MKGLPLLNTHPSPLRTCCACARRVRLVCTAAAAPSQLFSGGGGSEEPILDLEQLQFESAVEGEYGLLG